MASISKKRLPSRYQKMVCSIQKVEVDEGVYEYELNLNDGYGFIGEEGEHIFYYASFQELIDDLKSVKEIKEVDCQ